MALPGPPGPDPVMTCIPLPTVALLEGPITFGIPAAAAAAAAALDAEKPDRLVLLVAFTLDKPCCCSCLA